MDDKKYYRFDNGEHALEFEMNLADSEKFCIATCVKNENDYLIEWCEHYKKLGFDKIFIADNNDDDSLESLLKDYVDSGFVEIFNFRNTNYRLFQSTFNKMISNSGNYKWCGFFDADEFLELNGYSSIKTYLNERIPSNIYCVGFFWILYGGNGNIAYSNKSLEERFPQPCKPIQYRLDNGETKCLLRGGITGFKMGCHYPDEWPDIEYKLIYIGREYVQDRDFYKLHYPVNYKDGYIKHYYTKSYAEFLDKISRGWPDSGFKNNEIYRTKGYLYYNVNPNFKISDYANTTVYNVELNEAKSNIIESAECLLNLKDESSKIYYMNYNEHSNIVLNTYLIMNFIIAAKDHDVTFMIQSKNSIDNSLYNMLLETAIENHVRLVMLSDGAISDPGIQREIYNVMTIYDNKYNAYKIISI